MKNDATPTYNRIVIGASCYADTVPALDLAVNLAKGTNSRLEGLLLEEDAFFELAAWPSQKAISLRSGRLENITPTLMKEAFRRDAEIFRKTLATAAEQAALEWKFEQRRGSVENIIENTRSEFDIVLLGFQQLTRARPNILLIASTDAEKSDLRNLAERLPGQKTLKVEELSVDLANNLTEAQADAIMEKLGVYSYSAVLVPAPLADKLGIERLLGSARCPLIISLN